jgi:hypothetical protein
MRRVFCLVLLGGFVSAGGCADGRRVHRSDDTKWFTGEAHVLKKEDLTTHTVNDGNNPQQVSKRIAFRAGGDGAILLMTAQGTCQHAGGSEVLTLYFGDSTGQMIGPGRCYLDAAETGGLPLGKWRPFTVTSILSGVAGNQEIYLWASGQNPGKKSTDMNWIVIPLHVEVAVLRLPPGDSSAKDYARAERARSD